MVNNIWKRTYILHRTIGRMDDGYSGNRWCVPIWHFCWTFFQPFSRNIGTITVIYLSFLPFFSLLRHLYSIWLSISMWMCRHKHFTSNLIIYKGCGSDQIQAHAYDERPRKTFSQSIILYLLLHKSVFFFFSSLSRKREWKTITDAPIEHCFAL